MRDYVDLRVHDRVALDEIELYAEMLSAVDSRAPPGPAGSVPRRGDRAASRRRAAGRQLSLVTPSHFRRS